MLRTDHTNSLAWPSPNRRFLWMGMAILFAGISYYLFLREDRPWMLAILVSWGSSPVPALIGGLGWIPSFVHAAGFTLLTAAYTPATLTAWVSAAAMWAGINIAFEFLQLPNSSPTLVNDLPLSNLLNRFATSGVFDWWDILAAVAGASLGLGLCCMFGKRDTFK